MNLIRLDSFKKHKRRRAILPILTGILLAGGAGPALAQNIYKAATGTDLTAGASWTNSAAPGSGNNAVWVGSSLGANLTLAASQSWSGISVTNAASAIGLTGAGTLTLGTGGIYLSGVSLGMTNAVALGANQLWTASNGVTLAVSGAIGDGGSGYGLTLAGAGTMSFSGANTYTGLTTVTNGTIDVTGNESGATGGWSMPVNQAVATVNFQSGSTILVNAGKYIQVGSSPSSGTPNYQTMNAAGTVTNNGSLLVGRGGIVNINSGGVWVQGGNLTNQPPSGSGYGATMTVNTGGTFIYNGTGQIVVAPSSANSGSGTLTINGGTLVTGEGFLNNLSPASTVGAGQIILTNNGTLQLSAGIPELTSGVNSNSVATISLGAGSGGTINTVGYSTAITNVIGGSGPLTKLGVGTLTLSSSNTYTGGTIVNNGTLTIATPGALPATTAGFGNLTNATLNLQVLSQTLTNLTFGNSNLTSVVTITGTNGAALNLVALTNVTIAPVYTSNNLTVNLSGLTTFLFTNNGATFSVSSGTNPVAGPTGGNTNLVTLAAGTNEITAANLNVGSAVDSGGVSVSILNLGAVNVFAVSNLNVGNSGSRPDGIVQFAGGLTNPTLTVAGLGGGGNLTTLVLGSHDSFATSDAPADLLDTTAGTLNAQFGSITIGRENTDLNSSGRGVTITSTFKMGAGTLTAASLTLATVNNAANVTNDTVRITALLSLTNSGTAIITNLTFINNNLTNTAGTANTLTLSGTTSLTNGTTLETAIITNGAQASPATTTEQIILGNATLANIPSGNLSVSDVGVVLAGTSDYLDISTGQTGLVNSVISGTGALVASGGGLLTLASNNTYTGATTITNGTLALTGNGSITNSSGIYIAAGATLDVSGLASSTCNLSAGATVSAAGAASPATLIGAIGGTINLGSQPVTLTYDGSHPALSIFQGTLALNGNAFTVNGSSTLTPGTYTLIQQAGGNITGSGTYTVSGTALNGAYKNLIAVTDGNVNLIVDQPMAATMTVTATAGLGLRIALADLATNWSDANGYAVNLSGVSLTTTNGATLSTNNGFILYPHVTVNDQFSYGISDAAGGTNVGIVNIIANTAASSGQASSLATSGGTATVNFAGIPGYTYNVQVSTNLADWTTLWTTNAPAGGLFQFTDSNPPQPTAFYRLSWAP